jgi:hypothetical protein
VPVFSHVNSRIRACTRPETRRDAVFGGQTIETSRSYGVFAKNQSRHARAASVAYPRPPFGTDDVIPDLRDLLAVDGLKQHPAIAEEPAILAPDNAPQTPAVLPVTVNRSLDPALCLGQVLRRWIGPHRLGVAEDLEKTVGVVERQLAEGEARRLEDGLRIAQSS